MLPGGENGEIWEKYWGVFFGENLGDGGEGKKEKKRMIFSALLGTWRTNKTRGAKFYNFCASN